MKKVIFFEILRKLKREPHLMQKVKTFAIIGVIAFVLVGGVAVWAGISAMKIAATSANQMVFSPTTQGYLHQAKSELKQMQFQPVDCWGKAQSLLTVQPWLEKPALDNLKNLKVACLDSKPAVCEGHACEQIKELMHTAEGRTI